jgi:hypothetical protein
MVELFVGGVGRVAIGDQRYPSVLDDLSEADKKQGEVSA